MASVFQFPHRPTKDDHNGDKDEEDEEYVVDVLPSECPFCRAMPPRSPSPPDPKLPSIARVILGRTKITNRVKTVRTNNFNFFLIILGGS